MLELKVSAAAAAESLQLYPTLCDPVDCSLAGSSVHGIFQARTLDGLSRPPPGDLPNLGIKPRYPALQADSYCLSHQGSSA